ncbi:LOW QUALITY PROTEIN: tripartite motif-containing protein 77-like [Rhynchonycteris naso]
MDSAFMRCCPSELICSICKDYFIDSVTITFGHSFCTPCLCLLWEVTPSPSRCPVCRTISQKMNFKSTVFAKKQVHTTRKSVSCQLPSSVWQICETHDTVKNYFCPDDKSLLCILCSFSPEHATHRHSLVKQAAEQYRGFVNQRKMMIRAEYPKVYQYLHEERQKHLESLAFEGKIIFQQLRDNITKMVHFRKLLRRIYEELREVCCKADVELLQNKQESHPVLKTKQAFFSFSLQNSRNIVIRAQLMQLYMPQPLDPQLTTTITGMSERLNNFRVYITLDQKLKKYVAPLFEELRHLQSSPDYQGTPGNPASLEYKPSWGAQTFTTGKHYWEMDVGNSCNWIIGLCTESWADRKDMLLNSKGIFLLLCLKVDDHFILFSTSPLIRQYIQRPQGWVGVFLDYECGLVSFVNVAKSSLICNFLSCSFSLPLRPFIAMNPKDQNGSQT